MQVGELVLETQRLQVKKLESHWFKHMILCIKAFIYWMDVNLFLLIQILAVFLMHLSSFIHSQGVCFFPTMKQPMLYTVKLLKLQKKHHAIMKVVHMTCELCNKCFKVIQ